MSNKLNWGILGTGGIAAAFAKAVPKSKFGRLAAVGSRSQAKADEFGAKFEIPTRHGSYEALLADSQVQAVYICTPHPQHAEWAIKAAEAGKHILCEKPLALNFWDASAMIEAAKRHKVFLMEAFMYRCHPQTAKLVELLRKKVIGDVKVLNACFSFRVGGDSGRLLENAMGGGGILDVGCYCTSMARLVAGVAAGGEIAEPIQVSGSALIGQKNQIDEVAVATARFPSGLLAQLSTGVKLAQGNTVRIYGTEGSILLPDPWSPSKDGGTTKILLYKEWAAEPYETIEVSTAEPLYAIEADTVAEAVSKGLSQAPFPAMGWEDTLGNMRMLDQWREAIGLVYGVEKPDADTPPVHRRALTRRKDASMKYGSVPGVTKQVSRLVMGVDNQQSWPHASVMFDDFYERGGNAFDSAYIYGGGRCEEALGHWQHKRKLREQIVILGKGGHTPHCNPEAIRAQLKVSLQRFQTDYLDIYMLHRDNLDIPVADFAQTLHELKKSGFIRAFGGSNWSLERVQAFNDYAQKNGLTPMAAVSNNMSLARMIDPVWGGCLSVSDPESRAWFKKTQTPLMPWSSQARGFFTERSGVNKLQDKDLARCWYSPDNFQRKDRVLEMAAKRNVSPTAVALAYVLNQPFPTFPLIGPRQLSETASSLEGLDLELSEQDVKWLNLELG
jgi:predicted dehydrogenase/aryl-alcohol dehydrogenase-like predicted oxidoreductase